jgi:alkanesulfonate monooxygenase SsuD/methylene tetrahydromethanopterin reductase-like flavin-dependent oxidoreductase (luciferase family)
MRSAVGDYGHELEFGVFITPSSQQPEDVVELAVTADRAGLDLVTFQDHPYQPAFLDTWTLLSYVAARTERVHLTGNVLNLPLRQPAVLARAVASLDLLSGGRAELGIGAGGFWDAIEAMGGRRLTPGEAVDALAEAIEVMRLLWDTQTRGGSRFDGKYYQVNGAKRGPAPVHAPGVWVGAYKPRMLRLTGRLADGWLPSEPYLRPGQLAEGNAIIDAAAAEAGRDPAAIRRLLNLGPDQTTSADRLAELALTDGIGTFIVMADDPLAIQRYAAEVAPAVRELVAAARGGTTPATPRGAARNAGAGAELVAVHSMLRTELTGLRDLIAQVTSGEVAPARARSALNEMTMRQNNWTMGAYCESYCRVVTQHHSLEDAAVFPRLRAREPRLAPVLDRLKAEHVEIHEVLDSVDRALAGFIAEPAKPDELIAVMEQLSSALLGHLDYEESQLVEPLDRLGF